MFKTLAKQFIIMLLICVAIGLILAIIFYQYIPSNKIVPSKVEEYQTSESIKAEIQDKTENFDLGSSEQNYEITDSDLNLYKRTGSYDPGKMDPFAEVSEDTTSVDTSTPGSTNASSGSNVVDNTKSTTKNVNATDNYYKASGVYTSK